MLESVGPSYGSNSKRDEKEINKNRKEIDMEEEIMGWKYGTVLSNPEQFGYDNDYDHEEEMKNDPHYKIFWENIKEDGDGQSYSVEIPMSSDVSVIIRYDEKEEGSSENVDRKRNSKSDSKRVKAKVCENSGGFLRKAKTEIPKYINQMTSSKPQNQIQN